MSEEWDDAVRGLLMPRHIPGAIMLAAGLLFVAGFFYVAFAHDDGRFANSPLKPWFDGLKSGKGLCCSFADGVTIKDVDWDVRDGHYRVRLDGNWIIVPDAALVTAPNKFGRAVVWPFVDGEGVTQIRCFMPGSGA